MVGTLAGKAFTDMEITWTTAQLNRLCLCESNFSSTVLTQIGDSHRLDTTWMLFHLSFSAFLHILFTYTESQYAQRSASGGEVAPFAL